MKHVTYPLSLTDPNNFPLNDTADIRPLPPVASPSRIFDQAVSQISSIASSPIFATDTCRRCQAVLEVGKFVSLAVPSKGPAFFIAFCKVFQLTSNCDLTYGQTTGTGAALTQVLADADVGGYDGQVCKPN